jgi:hypothetical protein
LNHQGQGQSWKSTSITSKWHKNFAKENGMIEITLSEKAKTELLKVLKYVSSKSIRLIQQGYG